MEALNIRDYRNNLSKSFDKAESGQHILIKRKNKLFALISLGSENMMISPELQTRIEEAEHACKTGQCVTCSGKQEIEDYLNSI